MTRSSNVIKHDVLVGRCKEEESTGQMIRKMWPYLGSYALQPKNDDTRVRHRQEGSLAWSRVAPYVK